LVARVLRLAKLMSTFDRFKILLSTIANLGPSMATFGGVLFVAYYIYAIIGMELFADLIKSSGSDCGNPLLNKSTFAESSYCMINFNDVSSSFVLLFELMVVNQWHIITEGYVLVTSKFARIYFIFFHLTCVTCVLNIFTAFVIEAFILEISMERSQMELAVEHRVREFEVRLCQKHGCFGNKSTDDIEQVDADHDDDPAAHQKCKGTHIKFKLIKSKKVEDLLQRMFEKELLAKGIAFDISDITDNPHGHGFRDAF